MAKEKKKGTGVVLWSVLSVATAGLFAAGCIGTNLAFASSQAVNIALKTPTHKVKNADASAVYYESDFDSVEALEAHDREIAEQLTGEGAVLLKNDGALPLKQGAAVSTLSHSVVDVVTCVTGSADIDTSNAPTVKQALEDVGFSVNPTLWDFYTTGAGKDYVRTPGKGTTLGNRAEWHINEVPVSVYTDEVKSSFAAYNDAAIVMLSRVAGEGADLEYQEYTDGTNVLALSPEEQDMLKMANEHFDTVIVLINSTNALECDFLDDPAYGVDACLWIGYTGTWGLNAVADILAGNVNPSGKLVDTYCYDNTTAPALVGLYGASYTNFVEGDPNWYQVAGGGLDGNTQYITYQEGIYIGYRYYETRYEDVVMGTGNAGSYDYASTVAYPFGYGLSYTTFDWSDFQAEYDAASDSFTVSVKVKNTGSTAGKEVVEIYFQSPYTEYDKKNGIEKAAVELCGFDKTALLEPGQSETVTVTVPREELACYDTNGAGTYILDAGDYYLTAGHDAHDALNNILAAKGYTTANGMTANGNAEMAWQYQNEALDTTTYAVSSATGYPITNQFDSADLNKYSIEMTYLSRSDWQGTWPTVMELEANDQMLQELNSYQTYSGMASVSAEALLNDLEIFKQYGGYEEGSDAVTMPTIGADNNMTLGMMIGKDYDDPDWDKLLDQATFEEMAELVGKGYHNTAMMLSTGKPATTDDNGPQGFTQTLTGVSTCHCAYTDENIMAATWNVELMEEVGRCMGNDMLDLGASGLYGPAMNTHRNAYCGRNFEYYSEDGFLSGKIAAAEVQGIQSKGVYVYIKHFALNDTETGCRCISTWANEQSIREIYLKPFEIAVTEGDAMCVMNSFARVGTIWSGAHYGMQTEVLRNEWGMKGFDLTDFSGNSAFAAYGIMMKSFDVAWGLLAGTDSWDSSAEQWTADLLTLYKNDPHIVQAMRQATHRILYTVANSNAMNGFTDKTEIVKVIPWWKTALVVLDVVLAVLCIGSIVMLVKKILARRAAKANQ